MFLPGLLGSTLVILNNNNAKMNSHMFSYIVPFLFSKKPINILFFGK